MFSYLGLFLPQWSLFISFFHSFLLLCFLLSYLSFLIYSSLTSFGHPCPSALSIFFHLSSCPSDSLQPPSSSYFQSTLLWRRGHMPASVCCVMQLNISREHSLLHSASSDKVCCCWTGGMEEVTKESIENLACNLSGSAMTVFQGISITGQSWSRQSEAPCQANVQKYGAFLTLDLYRG